MDIPEFDVYHSLDLVRNFLRNSSHFQLFNTHDRNLQVKITQKLTQDDINIWFMVYFATTMRQVFFKLFHLALTFLFVFRLGETRVLWGGAYLSGDQMTISNTDTMFKPGSRNPLF